MNHPNGQVVNGTFQVRTLKPGAEASAEDIIAFCRTHLAHFKARTVILGPLPKTSTGKIQKFLLRERAKQGW